MTELIDIDDIVSFEIEYVGIGAAVYLVMKDGTRIHAGGKITHVQSSTQTAKKVDE